MRLKLTKLISLNRSNLITDMNKLEKAITIISSVTALLIAVTGVLEKFVEIYNDNLKED